MTTSNTWTSYDLAGKLEQHRADISFDRRDAAILATWDWIDCIAAVVGEMVRTVPHGWRACHFEGWNKGPDFFVESFRFVRA